MNDVEEDTYLEQLHSDILVDGHEDPGVKKKYHEYKIAQHEALIKHHKKELDKVKDDTNV